MFSDDDGSEKAQNKNFWKFQDAQRHARVRGGSESTILEKNWCSENWFLRVHKILWAIFYATLTEFWSKNFGCLTGDLKSNFYAARGTFWTILIENFSKFSIYRGLWAKFLPLGIEIGSSLSDTRLSGLTTTLKKLVWVGVYIHAELANERRKEIYIMLQQLSFRNINYDGK